MSKGKYRAYDSLHAKLSTKLEGKNIYRLTRDRKREMRHLGSVRWVKVGDNKLLVKDNNIMKRRRWRLCKLFNVNHKGNIALEDNNTKASDGFKYVKKIRVSEIKMSLEERK